MRKTRPHTEDAECGNVHIYVPPGAASFVSIYEPNMSFDVKTFGLSVPFDHPHWMPEHLPYPLSVPRSGYVHFKSKFPPEVDVRPASYKWLVEAIEENKVRNRRDTAIFEAHALELELTPYHWTFNERNGTSYRLMKVTILRQPGD